MNDASRIALGAVLCAAMSGPVAAQVADEAPAAQLEEIVVTAQKRDERLQDVPLSVTAISGEAISRQGLTDIADLNGRLPGLVVNGEAPTRPYIYIRGIGTRSFDVGSDGSVGVFVDGLYIPRFSGAINDLLDIERIEVLKGPQGTLYGRNTIGGAISIVSSRPPDRFRGRVDLAVSEFEGRRASASVSGPLNSTLRLRVGGVASTENGPIRDPVNGLADNRDLYLGRAALDWEPSEDLRSELTLTYAAFDQGSFWAKFVPNPDRGPASPPLLLAGPQLSTGAIAETIAASVASPFRQALDQPGFIRRRQLIVANRLVWDFGGAELTSLSGYIWERYEERKDFDATAFDLVDLGVAQRSRQFSQELRLASTRDGFGTFGGKVQWLIGGYWSREESPRTDTYTTGRDTIIAALAQPLFGSLIRNPVRYDVDLTTTSFAAFGNATVELLKDLSLTLGLRYSRDEKAFSYAASSPLPGIPPLAQNFAFDDEVTFTSTDPRISLSYKATPDTLFYVTYAQGYKSGGVQYANAVPELARQVFRPEHLTSYEVGLKSEWFDRRLRVNAAAFRYDYRDQQILSIQTINGLPTGFTFNADESRVTGADLEIQAAPFAGLSLTGSYSYLDAEFRTFEGLFGQDLSGNRLPAAPKHNLVLAVDYERPVAGLGTLGIAAQYAYRSRVFFDEQNTPFAAQPGVGTFDISARLRLERPDLTLTAYCENCGDQTIYSGFTVFSDGSGASAYRQYPRRLGVRLSANF